MPFPPPDIGEPFRDQTYVKSFTARAVSPAEICAVRFDGAVCDEALIDTLTVSSPVISALVSPSGLTTYGAAIVILPS